MIPPDPLCFGAAVLGVVGLLLAFTGRNAARKAVRDADRAKANYDKALQNFLIKYGADAPAPRPATLEMATVVWHCSVCGHQIQTVDLDHAPHECPKCHQIGNWMT